MDRNQQARFVAGSFGPTRSPRAKGDGNHMNVELTSEQAEEVLIALTMRAQQEKLPAVQVAATNEIGDYLADVFGSCFGWDGNVFRSHLSQSRRVRVLA